MARIIKYYPKAGTNQLTPNHPEVLPLRISFIRHAAVIFLLLQILFLGLFSYIYGSLFQQNSHIHNLNILFVDYDEGEIGHAVRQAYQTLQNNKFPSLQEQPPSEFQSVQGLREQVCNIHYWAALYIVSGASARLQDALSGGPAATEFNRSDILMYIWNEARYSATQDALISSNMQTLSAAARVAYMTNNGPGFSSVAWHDPHAVAVIAEPWSLVSNNIQPTTQGSRLIYNTLVIILILLQDFFYLLSINGLSVIFKVYGKLSPRRIICDRCVISLAYTLLCSLGTTSTMWAFRGDWNVNRNQFSLSWAVLWLFAHSNFLILDVFTIWLPPLYVPMAFVTWVVFSVTSILIPFELSPAFYRWAYAMPAHEVYQVLTDIWSSGCNPQLVYALTVLFAWEVVSLIISAIGVYRGCHFAVLAQEAQEAEFRVKLEAAVASEKEQDRNRAQGGPLAPVGEAQVVRRRDLDAIETGLESGRRSRGSTRTSLV